MLAIVNVLPEPVTPSNVWCFNPRSVNAFDDLVDCLGLITLRRELVFDLEFAGSGGGKWRRLRGIALQSVVTSRFYSRF